MQKSLFFRKNTKKPVSASSIENKKIDIGSSLTNIFGGRLLEIVEKEALLVAKKHADVNCVKTLGVDFVRFHAPIKIENTIYLSASVNRVWGEFLEVGVKIVSEDFRSLETKKILTAYFTFLILDDNNNSIYVGDVIPETKEQKTRYIAAGKRRVFLKQKEMPSYSEKH